MEQKLVQIAKVSRSVIIRISMKRFNKILAEIQQSNTKNETKTFFKTLKKQLNK